MLRIGQPRARWRSPRPTAASRAGRRRAERPGSRLGPSDNSDSGSDAVGTSEAHADSDSRGTGERGAVADTDSREGGDILPDRIVNLAAGEVSREPEDLSLTDLDEEAEGGDREEGS